MKILDLINRAQRVLVHEDDVDLANEALQHAPGADIRPATDEEAEECAFVVCVDADRKTPFTDNVFCDCAHCGRPIQHRPKSPKKPPKICMECALDRASGGSD